MIPALVSPLTGTLILICFAYMHTIMNVQGPSTGTKAVCAECLTEWHSHGELLAIWRNSILLPLPTVWALSLQADKLGSCYCIRTDQTQWDQLSQPQHMRNTETPLKMGTGKKWGSEVAVFSSH